MAPPALQKSKTQDQLKNAPVRGARVPVQSDTIDMARVGLGLYVAVAGDVKLTGSDGSDFLMIDVAPGVWHALEFIRVWSTGTDATGILVGNG